MSKSKHRKTFDEIYGTPEWDALPDGNDVPWMREHADGTVWKDEPDSDYTGDADILEMAGVRFPNVFSRQYILSHVFPVIRNDKTDDSVCMPWQDLEIAFQVEVETEEGPGKPFFTFLLERNLVQKKNLDVDELYRAARENVQSRVVCRNLAELLGLPPDTSRLYVLTMNPMNYGAAAPLLATECLQDLAFRLRTEELLILPSSVHEIIAAPFLLEDLSGVNHIIEHINKTEVSEKDRLCDHYYIYHAPTDSFSF